MTSPWRMGMAAWMAAAVLACTPAAPNGAALRPPLPATIASETLAFPSRNAQIAVPGLAPLTSAKAVFVADDKVSNGQIERVSNGYRVTKPLDAPAKGQLIVLDGDKSVVAYPYTSEATLVDVAIQTNKFAAAFRFSPAESKGAAGDRTVRVKTGGKLELVLADHPTVIARLQVDQAGQVTSDSSHVIGGLATLRFDPLPLHLDLGDMKTPVRLAPFEPTAKAGPRIVLAFPEIPTLQLYWANNLMAIDRIQLAPDGAVSHPDGWVKASAKAVIPETETYTFSVGASNVPWLLNTYEVNFSAGDRTLTCLRADRKLTLAFGRVDVATPPFDPFGATLPPCLKREGKRLIVQFASVEVDPGELTVPFALSPFERQYQAGKRTVALIPGVAKAYLSLNPQLAFPGGLEMAADGSIATIGPCFKLEGTTAHIRTERIQITATGSAPTSLWPYETQGHLGSRTVVMVVGSRAIINDTSVSLDADGTIVSGGPKVTGGSRSMTVAP